MHTEFWELLFDSCVLFATSCVPEVNRLHSERENSSTSLALSTPLLCIELSLFLHLSLWLYFLLMERLTSEDGAGSAVIPTDPAGRCLELHHSYSWHRALNGPLLYETWDIPRLYKTLTQFVSSPLSIYGSCVLFARARSNVSKLAWVLRTKAHASALMQKCRLHKKSIFFLLPIPSGYSHVLIRTNYSKL